MAPLLRWASYAPNLFVCSGPCMLRSFWKGSTRCRERPRHLVSETHGCLIKSIWDSPSWGGNLFRNPRKHTENDLAPRKTEENLGGACIPWKVQLCQSIYDVEFSLDNALTSILLKFLFKFPSSFGWGYILTLFNLTASSTSLNFLYILTRSRYIGTFWD